MYSAYYNWVITFLHRKPIRKKKTIEFIQNIESNIDKLPVPTQAFMRNKSIFILNGLARSSFILFNDIKKQIIENKNIINRFINNNSNYLITRADKSNTWP